MKNERGELDYIIENYDSYYDIEYLIAIAVEFNFPLNI